MDCNAKIRWVELNNDLSIGKIKEPQRGGVIGFKLAIVKRNDGVAAPVVDFIRDFKDSWPEKPPKRIDIKSA